MKPFSRHFWTRREGNWKAHAEKYLLAFVGVVLFLFVVFLLILNDKAQKDLRAAKETEFVEEVKRRAESLGFFLNDRRNDLDDLAVSPLIEAYFLNKDLGMSYQYGLRANLEEIVKAVVRLVDTRRFGDKVEAIYGRMAMLDESGAVLADVTMDGETARNVPPDGRNLAALLTPERTGARVRFEGCPSAPAILVLRPLFHKERFVGQLIAWLRWDSVRGHHTSFGRRQTVVALSDGDGCAFFEGPAGTLRSSLVRRLDGQPDGEAESLVDVATGESAIAIAVPIVGAPLRYVAAISDASLFGGNVSAWLVGGLYGLTLLLFVSGVVIWRSGMRRDRLENELREAQKLEAVGQLAGGIAHEINTPSQYIGNNLKFLADAHATLFPLVRGCIALVDELRGRSEFAERVREIDTLRHNADLDFLAEEIPSATEQSIFGIKQISRIVLAMKEFSHPGVDGKAPTDLNRAIESTITISRNEWKHVATVETEFDAALPAVICLPGEITQVLLNLVVNAAHAIREAGRDAGEGRIRITTAVEGDAVVVRVEDNGTGIPESVRGKIFNLFFTTKEVGKGTGQGLSIARDIVVNKHGGSIRFETKVGKGSTFIVSLPIHGLAKGRGVEEEGR